MKYKIQLWEKNQQKEKEKNYYLKEHSFSNLDIKEIVNAKPLINESTSVISNSF